MPNVTLDTVDWQYNDYKFPQPEEMNIPGRHDEVGDVRQVLHFVEIVDRETGDQLPEDILSEATWDYDNQEYTGEYMYIRGHHENYGEIEQIFVLDYIENTETGEILTTY